MTKMNRTNVNEYYAETYHQAAKNSDIREDKKLIRVFEDDVPNDKKILDVGCGPGVTLKFLAKKNKILGLDLVDEYLSMAKENGYYKTIKCNVEDGLSFNSSTFDIVVCTDLIEHVFDTEFVGKEIYRVLKDDGYAILNVPNHNVLDRRFNFLLGKGINVHRDVEDWNYFHIRFFTWDSWNKYLKKIGFKIVEFYPVPAVIPIPNFLRSKYRSKNPNSLEQTKKTPYFEQNNPLLVRIYRLLRFHVPTVLAKKYPNLFSYLFLVKVVKEDNQI
jgi:SAM-dependent methyltransferase